MRGSVRTAFLFSTSVGLTLAVVRGMEGKPVGSELRMPLTIEEVAALPYAPVLLVRDTVSSLGALAVESQKITLTDLVRYHGHPCDGLVAAAAGIAGGLRVLFSEAAVDRTDLVAAANGSPCYGDVTAYLTGARARYGTLIIDPRLGDEWVLHRRSTGKTVRVVLRPGFRPEGLGALEQRLRHSGCDSGLMVQLQDIQARWAKAVLSTPPEEVFRVETESMFPYAVGAPRADQVKAACRPGSAEQCVR